MVIGHLLKTNKLYVPELIKLNNCGTERVHRGKSLGIIVD